MEGSPPTPSIFDERAQSPFNNQTFEFMPSSRPVNVVYQTTGYQTNCRLYDQARRKQMKK